MWGRILKTVIVLITLFSTSQLMASVSITRTSAPDFYIDTGTTPMLLGQYAAYKITNDGATAYEDVWIEIKNFTGGDVSLASNENSQIGLGSLAIGQTKLAYFYLVSAGTATTTDQEHDLAVYEGPPSGGNTITVTGGNTHFVYNNVLDTIKANANKVNTVVAGPTTPALGGIMTITVTGDTGTIGAAKIFNITPAAYADWPANVYRLTGTSVTMTGGNNLTYTDELYKLLSNTSDTAYTLTYTFRAVGTSTAPAIVSPIANISSGAQIKHTSTSNFATFSPVNPATNNVIVGGKSASTSSFPSGSGGTITYTVQFQNQHATIDAIIDDIVDTLPSSPANATYQANSAKFGGISISDPTISGQVLTWSRQFTIPANSTVNLTYDVTIPNTDGIIRTVLSAI